MVTCGSDFLVADDFDAVMAMIDADMLENDTEMLSDLYSVVENLPSANTEMLSDLYSIVENLPSAKNSGQHHCHICFKVCQSESGLPRHLKSKHPENLSTNEESSKLKYSLDIFLPKSFVENSAAKLAEDACYPEHVMGEFKTLKFHQLMIFCQPAI